MIKTRLLLVQGDTNTSDLAEKETRLNDFFKENTDITIIKILQTGTGSGAGADGSYGNVKTYGSHLITIFYEEK